jgi:hypothetical protein
MLIARFAQADSSAPHLNQPDLDRSSESLLIMLATKILGYTSFVFILCFLAFGFWTWYRQRGQNQPK